MDTMNDMHHEAIEFSDQQMALNWKHGGNGGWVFIPDDRPDCIWFSPRHFTPTRIFNHPACRSRDGILL